MFPAKKEVSDSQPRKAKSRLKGKKGPAADSNDRQFIPTNIGGKVMTSNSDSNVSYLLVGIGLGAVGGLLAALLVRKETRGIIRERSRKSLAYLNEQAAKLRESADTIVQQGKKLIACKRSAAVADSTEPEKQIYQENQRENFGS
jgi:gas vesicle protein